MLGNEDMDANNNQLELFKNAFIKELIPYILQYGWSEEAANLCSNTLYQNPIYWKIYFENIQDLVRYFEYLEDQRMCIIFNAEFGNIEGIRNKIAQALKIRLVEINGGIEMIHKLGDFYFNCTKYTKPKITDFMHNLATAPAYVQNTWASADRIWILAGDKSTDFNYYTKRGLLSFVYVRVMKKLLTNPSNIESFIMSELNRIVNCGSTISKLANLKLSDIPILRYFI